MKQSSTTKQVSISGMTCTSCAARVQKALKAVPGVFAAEVDYARGTAQISYNPEVCSDKQLRGAVKQAGYELVERAGSGLGGDSGAGAGLDGTTLLRSLGLVLIILALFYLLNSFGVLNLLVPSQLASAEMPLIMLFVIGLITSVHCLAMCGGINISQSLPRQGVGLGSGVFVPALLYNTGRIISYTIVGALLGTVGLLLSGGGGEAGIPALMQGVLKLVAGVFMVVMGINLLGIFPPLRALMARLTLPGSSALGRRLTGKGPLVVGLLNGLMPCGPLQAMQLIALASASPLTGAASLLVFGLGTVPAMLGLGSLISALGQRFARRVMTVGATLVVVLGLAMFTQGLSLSGVFLPSVAAPEFGAAETQSSSEAPQSSTGPANSEQALTADGVQVRESTLKPRAYPSITVAAGTPVRWVINAPAESINGCNARAVFQSFGLEHEFTPGENIIEFTPERPGTYGYSCWMGMIQATITVT